MTTVNGLLMEGRNFRIRVKINFGSFEKASRGKSSNASVAPRRTVNADCGDAGTRRLHSFRRR